MATGSVSSLQHTESLAHGRERRRLGFRASLCLLDSQEGVALSPHPRPCTSPQVSQVRAEFLLSHRTPPGSQMEFLGVPSFPHPEGPRPPQSAGSASSFLSHLRPGRWAEASRPSRATPTLSLSQPGPAASALPRGHFADALPVSATQAAGPDRPEHPLWSGVLKTGNASGARDPSGHRETPFLPPSSCRGSCLSARWRRQKKGHSGPVLAPDLLAGDRDSRSGRISPPPPPPGSPK